MGTDREWGLNGFRIFLQFLGWMTGQEMVFTNWDGTHAKEEKEKEEGGGGL